ncbi:hypothetical protein BLOT_008345 [Blomia tropicalis]|nr:hypothetical protein BLOT_008345 [Blomia tropicalis]
MKQISNNCLRMQHNRMVILFTTLIIAAIIVGIQCNETKDTRDPMITEESVKTLTTNMAYSSRDQNSARFMSQTTQNRPTTSTSSSSNLKASSSSFFNMEPVGLTAQESGKMYKRSGRYWNDEHVPEYGHSMANERMPEYRHLRNNEHIPEYRHSRNNEHVPEYRHPSNNEQSHYGYNAPNPSMGHDYLEQEGYVKGKEISITPEPNKPITLHYRTHSQPITIHQTRIPGPKPEVKT